MLYHLSDKNHLFQELKPWRPCGTTLVLWFTNHSFLYRKWYFSLDRPPANKSSHCWNAFRAADWHHHLISSYQIRYTNKTQKKGIRTPYQRNVIRMSSDKVGNCYRESQQLDERTRFLSFGFRYENDMRLWMFEHCRWMAATHFFTGLTTASNYSTVASDSFKLFRWILYKTEVTPSWVRLEHLLQNPFP